MHSVPDSASQRASGSKQTSCQNTIRLPSAAAVHDPGSEITAAAAICGVWGKLEPAVAAGVCSGCWCGVQLRRRPRLSKRPSAFSLTLTRNTRQCERQAQSDPRCRAPMIASVAPSSSSAGSSVLLRPLPSPARCQMSPGAAGPDLHAVTSSRITKRSSNALVPPVSLCLFFFAAVARRPRLPCLSSCLDAPAVAGKRSSAAAPIPAPRAAGASCHVTLTIRTRRFSSLEGM